MTNSLQPIRLAMLGMIPGNGHPYSWAAIINGYDEKEMARCPYSGIPIYLKENRAKIGLPNVQVTHIWTDDPAEARLVAAAAKIGRVVARPEDALGQVDAVVIATDDGTDHARRARPFIEAGVPVFIDKPLATTPAELSTFVGWHRAGARFLSCSGARYDPELERLRGNLAGVGDVRWISAVMIKTWERYGIHRIEPIFTLLGPGFESITLGPKVGRTEVAQLTHRQGVPVSIAMAEDALTAWPYLRVVGNVAQAEAVMSNTFDAFKRQLEVFVDYVRTGHLPIPFEHTLEMMAVVIAGLKSRESGGQRVSIRSVMESLLSGGGVAVGR